MYNIYRLITMWGDVQRTFAYRITKTIRDHQSKSGPNSPIEVHQMAERARSGRVVLSTRRTRIYLFTVDMIDMMCF